MPIQGEILFVCVENAGRSQMAQAFAEKFGLRASSAGTVPSSLVNPVVVEAMREREIDLSRKSPKMLTSRYDQPCTISNYNGLLSRGSVSETNAGGDAKEAGRLELG